MRFRFSGSLRTILFASIALMIVGALSAGMLTSRAAGDGGLDPAFGTSGKVITDFNGGLDATAAMGLQTDGKIVVAGFATVGTQHTALARYNPNGTLDSSFGSGGKTVVDFSGKRDSASARAIQSDARI